MELIISSTNKPITMANTTEVWLRGPLTDVPAHLQPAAHALLQVKEEIAEILNDFPVTLLWEKPAGLASVGFHLKHIIGVIDRLFTYAEGSLLSDVQKRYLKEETGSSGDMVSVAALVNTVQQKIDWAVNKMKVVREDEILEKRGVGRAQLPSTVFGLIFHSAEHSMRHLGQLLVTSRILKSQHQY
jgi:hypothetical protein